MKANVLYCVMVMAVVAYGNPIGQQVAAIGAVPVPLITTSQYHAQDELGQAQFGYAHPGQAASNYRDALGNQIGSYSYFNPDGKQVQVSYTADHRGFRVMSNDLPVAPLPVQDTPEVAQAKATHLAALMAVRAAAAPVEVISTEVSADPVPVAVETPVAVEAPMAISSLPVPVEDTVEVAAAKREHALQWMAAKSAADAANLLSAQQVVPVANVANVNGPIIQQSVPMAYNVLPHQGLINTHQYILV